jgi:catechol 2,3-dioxygenase-like lactoylglutathione lyase family enzyme
MSILDPIREVRIALTVESFEQAVQFYRDRLGLPVVKQWQTAEGAGVVLALGPQTTLELLDSSQAALVDQVEVGRRVSGLFRLALEVQDVEVTSEALKQAGATLLSQPKQTPWGDYNARVETPDGIQMTVFQTAVDKARQNGDTSDKR